jgi:hypothetical protein
MNFITHNHRFALDIVESNPELKSLWEEICSAMKSISDERLKTEFAKSNTKMSLSDTKATRCGNKIADFRLCEFRTRGAGPGGRQQGLDLV